MHILVKLVFTNTYQFNSFCVHSDLKMSFDHLKTNVITLFKFGQNLHVNTK